ncbi:hypothetical protein AK812_SmicGene39812 [Symbiodinium microadriaticum]|uniref:Uncharacterized protein n=1 Tax=Symbiodinium microadriaticum TaxID=2951 RepID=A0A1Q9CAA5_SYMMI|nr:hypothetical protein AK812_SmicGene39812 [Symbiodinium microadriaticum]CAE7798207.1 unnamed protein product [Symbiodinium microadriaticum]
MSAHDSVIPESPPILENLQDGRETSKCMSPGPARGRSSLRLWFQSRLHQIEQEPDVVASSACGKMEASMRVRKKLQNLQEGRA